MAETAEAVREEPAQEKRYIEPDELAVITKLDQERNQACFELGKLQAERHELDKRRAMMLAAFDENGAGMERHTAFLWQKYKLTAQDFINKQTGEIEHRSS